MKSYLPATFYLNESKTKKKNSSLSSHQTYPELTLELKYKPYFMNCGPRSTDFLGHESSNKKTDNGFGLYDPDKL